MNEQTKATGEEKGAIPPSVGAAKPKARKKKPPPEIHINLAFCKGCDICVVACPKDCLAMERGKVVIINAQTCTGCLLCELRCPDFAIWIGEMDS